MAKASDNVFPKVITAVQTVDPSAPTDGSWKIYSKPGGIYARSSNSVVGPFGTGGGAGGTPTHVGAKAYNSTTQNINNAVAALTFDSEEFDTDSFHSTSTNTSRMTIPTGKGGYYLLQAGTFTSTVSGPIVFRVDGSTYIRGGQSIFSSSAYRSASAIASLTAGQYVEVMILNTGNNTNYGHASALDAQSWFAATLLGT